jgi:hypothetical protein
MPVDEGAPTRPPTIGDELEVGQHPTPGQELHHHCDRVGGEPHIGPEGDPRGARVGAGRVGVGRRRQQPQEPRGSGCVEDKPRGSPQREVLLGARRRGGSRGCLGARRVVERGGDRASAGVRELQRELDMSFLEQVRRRHPRHVGDRQSQTFRIEREGMRLWRTYPTPSASRRRARLVPVLRPQRQAI